MLIEVTKGNYYTVFHDADTGRHIVVYLPRMTPLQLAAKYYGPCWHSPENPCPAVEQTHGE